MYILPELTILYKKITLTNYISTIEPLDGCFISFIKFELIFVIEGGDFGNAISEARLDLTRASWRFCIV